MFKAFHEPQLFDQVPGLVVIVTLRTVVSAVIVRLDMTIGAREIVDRAEIRFVVTVKAVNFSVLAIERHGMETCSILAPELGRNVAIIAVQYNIVRTVVTTTAGQSLWRQVLLLVALHTELALPLVSIKGLSPMGHSQMAVAAGPDIIIVVCHQDLSVRCLHEMFRRVRGQSMMTGQAIHFGIVDRGRVGDQSDVRRL